MTDWAIGAIQVIKVICYICYNSQIEDLTLKSFHTVKVKL